jgi:hypothetical protein
MKRLNSICASHFQRAKHTRNCRGSKALANQLARSNRLFHLFNFFSFRSNAAEAACLTQNTAHPTGDPRNTLAHGSTTACVCSRACFCASGGAGVGLPQPERKLCTWGFLANQGQQHKKNGVGRYGAVPTQRHAAETRRSRCVGSPSRPLPLNPVHTPCTDTIRLRPPARRPARQIVRRIFSTERRHPCM